MDSGVAPQAQWKNGHSLTHSFDVVDLWPDREKRILIIEDDPDIVNLLALHFAKVDRLTVSSVADGRSGLEQVREQLPDLVILDLALPEVPGLDICRILKSRPETQRIPILVLTAKAEVIDRILALELGADDYVTKPFSPREVVLRSKAILRRLNREVEDEPATIGEIAIDPSRHSVAVAGRPVSLTAVEFKLLNFLMHRSGRVEPRERLLTEVWGYDQKVETRTIDTHVQRLRKKLGRAGRLIETVRGFGYRFQSD